MQWKEMPDGKEKYAAYLCSREWCSLREQVRSRSGGICERCLHNDMDHVHHLTYARKYRERLEDLQAICKECHEFTHGKSDKDPRTERPVWFRGHHIKGVYLAGKISGDNWRDEIFDGWSGARNDNSMGYSGHEWFRSERCLTVSFGAKVDYCGPWWADMDGAWGGHCSASECGFPHASGTEVQWAHGERIDLADPYSAGTRLKQAIIGDQVLNAINDSDMVFAWINRDDVFGTLFELGLAFGLGKAVVVASPHSFEKSPTWLARSLSTPVVADSAGEAWKCFWEHVEKQT